MLQCFAKIQVWDAPHKDTFLLYLKHSPTWKIRYGNNRAHPRFQSFQISAPTTLTFLALCILLGFPINFVFQKIWVDTRAGNHWGPCPCIITWSQPYDPISTRVKGSEDVCDPIMECLLSTSSNVQRYRFACPFPFLFLSFNKMTHLPLFFFIWRITPNFRPFNAGAKNWSTIICFSILVLGY